MSTLLPTFRVIGAVLLLVGGSHCVSGQSLALAQISEPVAHSQAQSLEQLLEHLEIKYDVHFSYATTTIHQQSAYYDQSAEADLESVLEQILPPLGLTYTEVERFYYIFTQQKDPMRITPLEEVKAQSGSTYSSSVPGMIPTRRFKPSAKALEITISGRITDVENDEPLPGVNVLAKGTTTGTVTDVDGQYRLTVADEVATLVFSSIGYLSEEITINGRSTIDMVLMPDIQSLSEVVVIGYGTKAKRDITTSISSIETEAITQTVALSPELAMQGRMTGVQVSGNDGNPFTRPTIRIRGQNTWRASDPLYVIERGAHPRTHRGYGQPGQRPHR